MPSSPCPAWGAQQPRSRVSPSHHCQVGVPGRCSAALLQIPALTSPAPCAAGPGGEQCELGYWGQAAGNAESSQGALPAPVDQTCPAQPAPSTGSCSIHPWLHTHKYKHTQNTHTKTPAPQDSQAHGAEEARQAEASLGTSSPNDDSKKI